MNIDEREDREFRWWHNGRLDFVVANWNEARRYGLSRECESCGAVFTRRDERYGCCPRCNSDYTESLENVWEGLKDPWDDDNVTSDEVEAARITNWKWRK